MKSLFYFAVTLLALGSALPAWAAPEAAEKKLPPSGMLSVSKNSGYNSDAFDAPFGLDVGAGTGNSAPIAGSVSRISPREWQLSVSNNSEDPHSASVVVSQYGSRGQKVKSDSFSYTLAPGESVQRTVAAAASTNDARLELQSWKNLAKPKKAPPAAPPVPPGSAPVAKK